MVQKALVDGNNCVRVTRAMQSINSLPDRSLRAELIALVALPGVTLI